MSDLRIWFTESKLDIREELDGDEAQGEAFPGSHQATINHNSGE
jgi:hypothetical protein